MAVTTRAIKLSDFLLSDDRDLGVGSYWWGRQDASVAPDLRCICCGNYGLTYIPAGDVAKGQRVALYECPACGDTTER